jgi:hypothetical protein
VEVDCSILTCIQLGSYPAVVLCPICRCEAECIYETAAPGRADCFCAGLICLGEAIDRSVHGSAFAQHVPDDRKICAEDAAERLEDGVCAERDVVPGEVGTAATKDNSESDGGYDAGSVSSTVSFCAMYSMVRKNLRKANAENET